MNDLTQFVLGHSEESTVRKTGVLSKYVMLASDFFATVQKLFIVPTLYD